MVIRLVTFVCAAMMEKSWSTMQLLAFLELVDARNAYTGGHRSTECSLHRSVVQCQNSHSSSFK